MAHVDRINLRSYRFLGLPLVNVILPLIWKSFAFVYSADMVLTLGLYWFRYWSPEAQVRNAEAAAAAAAAEAAEAAAAAEAGEGSA